VVTFLLVWMHAVLAGTDSGTLLPLYLATGGPVLAGVAHRWWTARARPVRVSPASRQVPLPASAQSQEVS
jgi:hypothetical protein